jgi:light-regulated signal transduction histidine kinase (bacteriophytochrome)
MQEPLRKVVSFGHMLRQKCSDGLGQSGNDYLNRMLDATKRMQSLLKRLLEYSRVTAKADPFVEIELAEIVGEVLSDLEVRIEKTGGKVLVGELPVIKGDPTQMRQLFQNLIGNALKFHKKGEKPVIEVRSAVAGGQLHIVVEDNGIGFEEQFADRIFAPFQRLHGRDSEYEGTGMGLAICKKIVERHGGSITAESTPGMGASFIVQLPMRQSTRSELSRHSAAD